MRNSETLNWFDLEYGRLWRCKAYRREFKRQLKFAKRRLRKLQNKRD